MALVLADRVQQTGSANTTVSFTLSGSVAGYQSFSVVGNGNTTYYSAFDNSGNWEVGIGTYSTTGPTLTRTTVLSSSNSGAAVSAFSGFVNIFITYPSENAVTTDTLAYPPAIGGTTPAAGTFTTLTLSGAGNNFFGDFSNATLLSRNAFKTSTTNGSTGIYALPNGTSTAASWQATNAADPTNASKVLIATNGSTDVQLVSGINGTGTYLPLGLYNGGAKQVEVASVPSAVNYIQLKGSATTLEPVITATGTDTNVALAFKTQGTGAIDLAAGSSGVNISNGGTVTAITSTSGGSNYTSAPTATISAPTTAGGVQATASPRMQTSTATIVSGGSGYVVGDTIVLVGGTYTGNPTTFTVATVSGGVVTSLNAPTSGNFGNYTVVPVNTISTTSSGVGTGCTLNITTWNIGGWSITNAGSGYVEQPTVSFSGGGGSGAAAYATVGSGTVVKSLGATLDVSVDNTSSPAFRFYNSGGTGVNYWSAGSGSSSPFLFARGSTNTQGNIASNGTSALAFFTNGGATQQFAVAHTASAVNYVQVTGAATSVSPQITAQGSDSSINLAMSSKGGGSLRFFTNNVAQQQFIVTHTNNAVNYFGVTGGAAGVAPVMSSQGSDTNIDLTLTPKGTGVVQFGTYTATVTAVAGYIQIKDSGGTLRKLAVLT